MSNLFSYDYNPYDIVKCRRNVNFEEMDTESPAEENNGF